MQPDKHHARFPPILFLGTRSHHVSSYAECCRDNSSPIHTRVVRRDFVHSLVPPIDFLTLFDRVPLADGKPVALSDATGVLSEGFEDNPVELVF